MTTNDVVAVTPCIVPLPDADVASTAPAVAHTAVAATLQDNFGIPKISV